MNKNEYCLSLFFAERFDEALEAGMKEKDAIGWSFTFMKQDLIKRVIWMTRYSRTNPMLITAVEKDLEFGMESGEIKEEKGRHTLGDEKCWIYGVEKERFDNIFGKMTEFVIND